MGRVHRAGDLHARVPTGELQIGQQGVIPRIDEHLVTRLQFVSIQQGQETGHWSRGALAAVGVVTQRSEIDILVTYAAAIVDIE